MKKKLVKILTYNNVDEFFVHANFQCKSNDIKYNSTEMYFEFWYKNGQPKERHVYTYQDDEDEMMMRRRNR